MDGSRYRVDEDGWADDYDDLDKADAIDVVPISVRDIEDPQ
ncbi:hypothetical protein [Nocardia sp. NPDC052566]